MQEAKALPNSRKRPLEDGTADIQYSLRYKIRAVVRDLRPHFIEVLKTPDFRNCMGAGEIRTGMKLLIDLYKQLVEEAIKQENCSNGNFKPAEHQRDVKSAEYQQDVKPPENLSQNGVVNNIFDKHSQGTHIVGGSAFGWNFVTFNDSNVAVYYGRTKEDFRAANPLPTE